MMSKTARALRGQTPVYLSLLLYGHAPSRSVRSADQGLLVVPCPGLN